jgi:beta-ribofuranosylaminobenzene 5'-phosphate synthase
MVGAVDGLPASQDVEWHGAWTPSRADDAARVAELAVAQRLLLTTDGTVTTALATLLDEPIGVRVVGQRTTALVEDDDELSLWAGGEVLERRVVLHGVESHTPLLYGASRIVAQRLPRPARDALIDADVAIGLVLRTHRIETFRTPLSVGVKWASEDAAAQLGVALMCWRTYAIHAGRRPLMIVHEQFPAAGFGAAG